MIISASRRTDIPALYSKWMVNRLKTGYVLTVNPWNIKQIKKVSLDPDDVDGIVFWTKDPLLMLDKLDVIDSFSIPYYFQFTLTPYDKRIERHQRNKKDIAKTLIELCKCIGKDRVVWRYDPIILNDDIDINYHEYWFAYYCELFYKYQDCCVISFVDSYTGLDGSLIRELGQEEIQKIAVVFSDIASMYSISLNTCCEKYDLDKYGIGRSKCVDFKKFEYFGKKMLIYKKDKNQREYCMCDKSVDIGMYQTCTKGCIYCYATKGYVAACRNHIRHDPLDEYMISKRSKT